MIVHNFRPPRSCRAGFSLIELLAVTAIVGLLATAVLPALSSIQNGSSAAHSTLELAGFLEQARQYATSQNTYVYVSFLGQTGSGGTELWVAAAASNSGSELSSQGTQVVGVGAGDNQARQLSGVVKLRGMVVKNKDQVSTSTVVRPDPSQSVNINPSNSPGFGPIKGQDFPVAFWFTPDGSACTDGLVPTRIEFAIQPETKPEDAWASVIQVAGPTGSVRVYRTN